MELDAQCTRPVALHCIAHLSRTNSYRLVSRQLVISAARVNRPSGLSSTRCVARASTCRPASARASSWPIAACSSTKRPPRTSTSASSRRGSLPKYAYLLCLYLSPSPLLAHVAVNVNACVRRFGYAYTACSCSQRRTASTTGARCVS